MNNWNVMNIGSGYVASISGLCIGLTRVAALWWYERLRHDPHSQRVVMVMHDREISAWIQGRMPCDQPEVYCRAGYEVSERCHLDLCALLLSTGENPGWIEPSTECNERTWL